MMCSILGWLCGAGLCFRLLVFVYVDIVFNCWLFDWSWFVCLRLLLFVGWLWLCLV